MSNNTEMLIPLRVQKLSTRHVDEVLAKRTWATQEAYSVCRTFAALLGDCAVSEFKANLAAYLRSAEYLRLSVVAKNELKLLMNWR